MTSVQESEVVLWGAKGEALVRKTPDVCGGAACIKNSRIMVWLLVAYRMLGLSDAQLLNSYPTLTTTDLDATWDYYRLHPGEIDLAIQESDDPSEDE